LVDATVATALGSASAVHGSAEQNQKRKALNAFIRSPGSFDAVMDFDAVMLDPATGGSKAAFLPASTSGGLGEKLHPNRTGYRAMGFAVDPVAIVPGLKR
jgi:lysophospholipase L1-like esterase